MSLTFFKNSTNSYPFAHQCYHLHLEKYSKTYIVGNTVIHSYCKTSACNRFENMLILAGDFLQHV